MAIVTDPQASIRTLDNSSFHTTRKGDQIQDDLKRALGQKSKNVVARLAIARSLSFSEPPPGIPDDERDDPGAPIRGSILFGDDLSVWIGLVTEHAGLREPPSTRDLQQLVSRHWRHGLAKLEEERAHCRNASGGDDFDKFVLQLAGRAGWKEDGGELSEAKVKAGEIFVGKAVPVMLQLGDPAIDLQTRQVAKWHINARGTSPHFAVMGALGTGKTRMAMQLIRQARKTAGCPIILLDMAKGDLAADEDLIKELDAIVVKVPSNPVPLDVLHTQDSDETELVNSAMRFRDSFHKAMTSPPGAGQMDALREAALRALRGNQRPVRITDVRDRLREVYAERKRRDDVVVATFNDLTSWTLFDPKLKPAEFFSKSWIIDVHEAPEAAQRLVVFLLLDALYTYLKLLPDSEIDRQGNRALRVVLGIDEARKVLGYRQPSLVGLIRESRSKGGAVALISQSPDDFDGEDENFLENIGLGFCFRTNARSRALTALLGATVDLGSLANGVGVTRLVGVPGITRIQAWQQ